jgi:peptide-methionine (S)-S-oxide reductase
MSKILGSVLIATTLFFSLGSCAQKQTNAKATTKSEKSVPVDLTGLSKATFASGCFWCLEGVYESVKGVKEAISGYAGGTEANPTYEGVGSGRTGHAEALEVYYDPKEVSFETLLQVYFDSQDPTQVNGQGPDKGSQYRSILFYTNDTEKQQVIAAKAKTQAKYSKPVAAEIMPLTKFWPAEQYHQDFVKLNPTQGYVMGESIPRIKRFQKLHPELIKEGAFY